MNYGQRIITRIKISGYVLALVPGVLITVIFFPITYWIFGVGPMDVADWSFDNAETLGKQL